MAAQAEEIELRQREERIRRTEDEIFKQVQSILCSVLTNFLYLWFCCFPSQMMHVHHGTVELYLEDIIIQSLEKTADD